MAFVHGKSTKVYGGAVDFSRWLNTTDVDQSVDMAEVTPYGSEAKRYIPGLLDGTISFAGMVSDDQTQLQEDTLEAMFQSASGQPWAVVPAGASAVGQDATITNARLVSHSVSSPVGDVVALAVSVQADGAIASGFVLHPEVQRTGAGNAASIDLGAAFPNGAVASVHLLSFTGTSITVAVQDSANNSVFVDLIEFTSLTARGAEFRSVAGTVDRYVRAEWSGTFSSAIFVVVFAAT